MTEGFIQNVQFDLFESFIQNVQFDLFEGFIQNVQFDLFSVELVIGDTDTATLLLAENYVTIREVFVDNIKVEPNENKQIFLTSGGGGDDLWELNDSDILLPKNNKTFTIKKANEVNVADGNPDNYLNEKGDFTQVEAGQVKYTPSAFVESVNVQDAITELGYYKQETLESGTNIKTINGESILGSGDIEVQGGGSTDIISTNTTNNTGTIVIDTTPNWQRVNISSGGNTLFLDYASGVLPNKNREYLLIINNATASTITLTLPTASFEKGGITYYFINSEVSVPIEAGKSIEVNVIFIFTSITTCNVRTLISQF